MQLKEEIKTREVLGKVTLGKSDTFFDKFKTPIAFDAIRIQLASPEKIRSWSYGEVKKPETINYRSFKPERDGLFCACIFGPVKDWECNCGKYKRMKHRGIVCDKCGVEVIQSKVRRERMGHIALAAPVAHIWFLKVAPSRIGMMLDLSVKQLEQVIYCESYIVVDPKQSGLREKEILTEEKYRAMVAQHGPNGFVAGMGAEAIRDLLKTIDLDHLCRTLHQQVGSVGSETAKKKLTRRLKTVESFRKAGNRPEWMILEVVPVLPPDLRPLVPLDGGRFATSDLNDLYRRVIYRNNRLKRLMELRAPSIIIRNEKRMLQEAVDALFDNGSRTRAILNANNKRPLRSLADMLKGKQGRFRQNLLGKRVDYSGRSVIVVGPELKLNQCGLPKKMALELFKPFLFQKLEEKGLVTTIKGAKKLVEQTPTEIWDVLEEITREHPVLLNRAPTLHRLGIQAFDPVLVEGKAIRLHPLVCAAFNADFDGDQIAVHVPLSLDAQVEARVLMLSARNLLSPASGRPIAAPSQDMVLGCYWLTKEQAGAKGEGKVFSGPQEVRVAYDAGQVEEHATITVRLNGSRVKTTVGRVILSESFPPAVPFSAINRVLNKKELSRLVDRVYRECSLEVTVHLLDALKDLGFSYATRGGISVCLDDMHMPTKKAQLIEKAKLEVAAVTRQYSEGLLTDGERYNKVVDIWAHVTELVANEMMKELSQYEEKVTKGSGSGRGAQQPVPFNSIFLMLDSGARGSAQQMRQLGGMRGLMAKPSGEIIETPIISTFREGLTVVEYFISTHGARKGLADTALKTANSGYLTRRLVDVAQDVVLREADCQTTEGITVCALVEGGEVIMPLEERILGRMAAEEVYDPLTKELICARDEELDEKKTQAVIEAGIDRVKIRSVLTCQTARGICAICYGRELATGRLVEIGTAVGIVAAQSIGEPGTQLTMRTFHIGGTASRIVERAVLVAKHAGKVQYINVKTVKNKEGDHVVMSRSGKIAIIDPVGREKEKYAVVYGAVLKVKKEGTMVEPGQELAGWDPYSIPILTEVGGKIAFGDIVEGQTMREEVDEVTGLARKVIVDHPGSNLWPRLSIKDEHNRTIEIGTTGSVARYFLSAGSHILVEKGQKVSPGDVLAKIPRETTKTKDITGGLPRVAELFEARKPRECAIISEIDGKVEYGGFVGGIRKIVVSNEVGDAREYYIPKGKHVNVHEGDIVQAGEPLMDGSVNPHDILDILGPKGLQRFLVDEIQEVYRLQGVALNDKHIEVVVRQILRKVRIEESGDTHFLIRSEVDRIDFDEENERVMAKGGRPAIGKPVLCGITKAALATNSFISAASFQETTRVLTEAASSGMVDHLFGLKENVIVGRLIPVGTGLKAHREVFVKSPQSALLDEIDSTAKITDVEGTITVSEKVA